MSKTHIGCVLSLSQVLLFNSKHHKLLLKLMGTQHSINRAGFDWIEPHLKHTDTSNGIQGCSPTFGRGGKWKLPCREHFTSAKQVPMGTSSASSVKFFHFTTKQSSIRETRRTGVLSHCSTWMHVKNKWCQHYDVLNKMRLKHQLRRTHEWNTFASGWHMAMGRPSCPCQIRQAWEYPVSQLKPFVTLTQETQWTISYENTS